MTKLQNKTIRELKKQFGDKYSTVKVKMRYVNAIGRFIQKVEAAQICTINSKQVF